MIENISRSSTNQIFPK